MNYFIVVWDGLTAQSKIEDRRPSTDNPPVRRFDLEEWSVLLYSELSQEQTSYDLGAYLNSIEDAIRNEKVDNLFVFFHFAILQDRPKDLMQRQFREKEKRLISNLKVADKKAVKVWGFQSNGELGEILIKLPDSIPPNESTTINSFVKQVEDLVRKIGIARLISNYSDLKHRISRLFLSMELSMLCIAEEREFEREGKKKVRGKYSWEDLKDVLDEAQKMGNTTHFKRKLADFQYYVAKLPNKYRKDDDRSLKLPSGNSVVDLVNDISNEAVTEINEDKETLFSLAGIENVEGTPRAKADSLITRFVLLLDDKIPEPTKVNEDTVDEILGFFTEGGKTKGWEVGPYKISNFYDWFCALMNVLNLLQQKLGPMSKTA